MGHGKRTCGRLKRLKSPARFKTIERNCKRYDPFGPDDNAIPRSGRRDRRLQAHIDHTNKLTENRLQDKAIKASDMARKKLWLKVQADFKAKVK